MSIASQYLKHELPKYYDDEQHVVDGISRELNGGELKISRSRIQEVAGILSAARCAYRVGRSALDLKLIDDIVADTNRLSRSFDNGLDDSAKNELIVRAYEEGKSYEAQASLQGEVNNG